MDSQIRCARGKAVGHTDAFGIEIDESAVQERIRRGVPVYHGDMLEGMAMFSDHSFDCDSGFLW